MPISIGLIVGLFAVQHFGTAGVGRWFGPIMLVWFVVLFALGAPACRRSTRRFWRRCRRCMPIEFAVRHKVVAFVALGAVTLAFTGAEALYADMGHFGRAPIRMAWLGARAAVAARQLLRPGRAAAGRSDVRSRIRSSASRRPGRSIRWSALATAATVIASQATISGAFSMAQQAALLGLSPRVHILHTSASEFGQIYVPAVNWLQMAGVVALVLAFKSSTNLAAAYGIAVTGTMLVTSVLMLGLARARLEVGLAGRRSWSSAASCWSTLTLVSSNMVKFLHGGWVPLADRRA